MVRTVSNVMGRDLYLTWLDCTAFSTLMDDKSIIMDLTWSKSR